VTAVKHAHNENGRRIGETHPVATIPDAVVRRIRDLREHEHWSLRRIAADCGVSVMHVWRICRYEVRAQIPVEWRTPNATPPKP
jgi:AraC-like DNA-binding protein